MFDGTYRVWVARSVVGGEPCPNCRPASLLLAHGRRTAWWPRRCWRVVVLGGGQRAVVVCTANVRLCSKTLACDIDELHRLSSFRHPSTVQASSPATTGQPTTSDGSGGGESLTVTFSTSGVRVS